MVAKWTGRFSWGVLFILMITAWSGQGSNRVATASSAAGSVLIDKTISGKILERVAEVSATDMIAYWWMDETEGSVFYDYIGSNDGVCTDQCPDPRAGKVNGAQRFSNDEVNIAYDESFDWDGNSSFSIELWVRVDVYEGNRIFVSRHGGEPAWWVGGGNHAVFSLRDSNGVEKEIYGGTGLNDGAWHHVVAVHDGIADEIQLYVDGLLETFVDVEFTGDWISDKGISIGYHNVYIPEENRYNPSYHFYGILDEIAIYGKVLSPSEIEDHYNDGLGRDYLDPVNLTVNIDGAGSVQESPEGLTYRYGQPVILTATPDPGQIFFEWSGDLTGYDNPATLTMDGDKVVTASFSEPIFYSLAINTNGEGSVNVDPEQDEYLHGTRVTLSAVPVSGWVFNGWSGDLAGSDNPVTITMNEDKVITASFTKQVVYTLALSTVGEGRIDVDPYLTEYLPGTQVTLSAVPVSGWVFDGWSGDLAGSDNPATITMNEDKVITASFVQEAWYTLTVGKIGEGSVNVEPEMDEYLRGTQVTLSAVPATGWTFKEWSGDLTGSNNPATLRMTADLNVVATFSKIDPIGEDESKVFLPFNMRQ
jgi:uncharacterized repeat protein (TIGR02543 family)